MTFRSARLRLIPSLLTLLFAAPGFCAQTGEAPADPGLTAQAVYQVLLGEVALRRGQPDVAFAAWRDLAEKSGDPEALRRAIEIGIAARQYELVLPLARQWVAVDPDRNEPRQTLNSLLMQTNHLEELTPQLADAFARDPQRRADGFLQLNRSLARPGNEAAALELVQSLTRAYPELPEAQYALAIAAERAGHLDTALEAAQQARNLRPGWAPPWMLASQLTLRSQPDNAISLMQTYISRYAAPADQPEGREPRLHLARLLVNVNRYSEARDLFRSLARLYPQDPEVLYPVAVLSLQLNDLASARPELEALLTLPGADTSAAHYFLAQMDEQAGNLPDAIGHYQQVHRGDHWLAARLRTASLQARQGDFAAARATLQPPAKVSHTFPEVAKLGLAEATLLKENGQHAEALNVLEKLLTYQPDNADLLYEAALLAEKQGQLPLMETRLRHLLKLQPDNPLALNALGYSLADHKLKLAEARKLVTRALALLPEDAYIMDSLGWVLFREGKLAEAHAQLATAFEHKRDPEIAAHLGEVLWHMKRQQEARECWAEALSRAADNSVLRETLQRLSPDLLPAPAR